MTALPSNNAHLLTMPLMDIFHSYMGLDRMVRTEKEKKKKKQRFVFVQNYLFTEGVLYELIFICRWKRFGALGSNYG